MSKKQHVDNMLTTLVNLDLVPWEHLMAHVGVKISGTEMSLFEGEYRNMIRSMSRNIPCEKIQEFMMSASRNLWTTLK